MSLKGTCVLLLAILLVGGIALASGEPIHGARSRPQSRRQSMTRESSMCIQDKGKDLDSDLMIQKGPNCMLCQVVVQELFKFMHQNRTEDEIRHGLEEVCTLIYSRNNMKLKQCEEMVQTYTRELVQLLVDETNPQLICTLLGQCTYQTDAPKETFMPRIETPVEPTDLGVFLSMVDPSVKLGSKKTCYECKIFIEYLRNEIENPKDEAQVVEYIKQNLCDSFDNQKLTDACNSMVEAYADILFKAIVRGLNPKEACVNLKACPAKKLQVKPKASFCDQCIDVVTKIDDFLSHHSVDHDVNTIIDQVCKKLGNDSLTSECTFIVQTIGKNIADVISGMDSPVQVCSKILIC